MAFRVQMTNPKAAIEATSRNRVDNVYTKSVTYDQTS